MIALWFASSVSALLALVAVAAAGRRARMVERRTCRMSGALAAHTELSRALLDVHVAAHAVLLPCPAGDLHRHEPCVCGARRESLRRSVKTADAVAAAPALRASGGPADTS